MPQKGLYRKLFTSTFFLSAFTFGGGYVIVPLMRKKFVEDYKWFSDGEMLDMVTISQSAPGPIAVNASILTGYRLAGISRAFCALAGTILPPLIILSVISLFYSAFKENRMINAVLRGMSAGVAAVVVDAVIKMGKGIVKTKDVWSMAIMVAAFIAIFIFGIDIKIILLSSGLLGLLIAFLRKHSGKKKDDPR